MDALTCIYASVCLQAEKNNTWPRYARFFWLVKEVELAKEEENIPIPAERLSDGANTVLRNCGR